MSIVYTEITLRNAVDVGYAKDGIIEQSKVRALSVTAVVDTGAWTLVINEETRNKLGLNVQGKGYATLADGKRREYDLVGPLEVQWEKRRATCDALLLPNSTSVLLGAIPLEAMDLIVHPNKEQVVGAHGDEPMYYVYGVEQ